MTLCPRGAAYAWNRPASHGSEIRVFKSFGAPEIILVIFVIILLFGARKLPETARGMGQALRIFKKEVKDDDRPTTPTPEITTSQAPAPPTVTAEPVQQPAQQPAQEHDHPQR